jgi:hypothetical protein
MVQRSYVPSRSSYGQMTKRIWRAFFWGRRGWVVAIRTARDVCSEVGQMGPQGVVVAVRTANVGASTIARMSARRQLEKMSDGRHLDKGYGANVGGSTIERSARPTFWRSEKDVPRET